MLSHVQFVNVDPFIENLTEDTLDRIFGNVSLDIDIIFEKTTKGLFHGKVLTKLNSKGISAEAEAQSLLDVCLLLRKKIIGKKLIKTNLVNEGTIWDVSASSSTNTKKNQGSKIFSKNELSSLGVKVLIIDDDIEAMLPLNNVFEKIGIKSTAILGEQAAIKQIGTGRFDILILDWDLGTTTGGDLIQNCMKSIRDRFSIENALRSKPMKIVTYSGHGTKRIGFGSDSMSYFSHVNHWQKPLKYHDLEARASNLIFDYLK